MLRNAFISIDEPNAKSIPIIAKIKICFPLAKRLGFPADVIIKKAPIKIAKVANGAAITFTMNLYILPSIIKKSFSVQPLLQGTKPCPRATIGKTEKQNSIIAKNFLFIKFLSLALCPRQDSSLELLVRSQV